MFRLQLNTFLLLLAVSISSLAKADVFTELAGSDQDAIGEKLSLMEESQIDQVDQRFLKIIEQENIRQNPFYEPEIDLFTSTDGLCLENTKLYVIDASLGLLRANLRGEEFKAGFDKVLAEHHRIISNFTPLPELTLDMDNFGERIDIIGKRDQEVVLAKTHIHSKINVDEKRAVESLLNMTICSETLLQGNYAMELVNLFGWPDMKVIGEDRARDFWLLAQHLDSSVETQKKFIPLMSDAVKKGKTKPVWFAYLYDRVMVNSGQKQRYGTQLDQCGLRPLEDPQKVDIYRSEMGMETIGSYLSWVPNCGGEDIAKVIADANIKTVIPKKAEN